MLRALTPIIHPSIAYLLLEVTTRVLLLYNNFNSGGGNNPNLALSATNEVFTVLTGSTDSIIDDSLIMGILDRAPRDDNQNEDEMYYTTTSVIQKLIEIAGVSSRIRIAEFFPYYCLTDEHINVRRAALESLLHYPELVLKYSNEILLAFDFP